MGQQIQVGSYKNITRPMLVLVTKQIMAISFHGCMWQSQQKVNSIFKLNFDIIITHVKWVCQCNPFSLRTLQYKCMHNYYLSKVGYIYIMFFICAPTLQIHVYLYFVYPVQAPPHARSASTGTSSECTPAGSSSPQSNVDVYDVKFQGMDAVCIDNSHPQENGTRAQLLHTKHDTSLNRIRSHFKALY